VICCIIHEDDVTGEPRLGDSVVVVAMFTSVTFYLGTARTNIRLQKAIFEALMPLIVQLIIRLTDRQSGARLRRTVSSEYPNRI